ncbi:hypothetical protein ACFL6I_12245 [candidate division KSB1 bacterium]
MRYIKEIIIVLCLLPLTVGNVDAQKQQDSITKNNLINRYEPQGKPWTQISGQSPEEFNLSFSSAKAEREGGLNSKWKIAVGYTLVQGFNLGEKYITSIPNDPMNGNFWGYSYYVDANEKAQMGYQFSLEAVSKSFLSQRVSFRMSIGLDKFYYKGIATKISVNRINPC